MLELTRWQKTDEHREAEARLRAQEQRVAALARQRVLQLRVDNMRRKRGD